jgi:predicted helicase
MITNHGYLDNPTFRGMRQQLMQTFSEIYLLNLHGNAKKKEVCPDGSKDENVFDIQQGVAIGFFVKVPGAPGPSKVHYADLWGLRERKYQALSELDLSITPWQEILPKSPSFLFIPQDTNLLAEYETGWSIQEIMSLNGDPAPGIVTTQDEFAISWSSEEAVEKVNNFLGTSTESEARQLFTLCSQSQWSYDRAKKEMANGLWKDHITTILYRPFDLRWTVYNSNVAVHLRNRVSHHMLAGVNLGLCTNRQVNKSFQHVFCTRNIINDCALSAETRERTYLFPMYLFHNLLGQVTKTSNINPAFIKDLSDKLNLAFMPEGRGDLETTMGPEDVFSYAYAVFHSPTYRQRYSEFLKIDFPRLPLTGNKDLFKALVGLGAELVSLHLMESPRLETFITRFPVPGSQMVEAVRYEDNSRRVYINSEQWFEGVPPEVWAFTIGGYQVCHKWLKDRKGRTLTFEDLHHYQKIIVALAETIRLMAEIDAVILAHGGWPIAPP